MMWWSDHGWGWWPLMPLVMLVFWAAVIWLVVTVVRHASTPTSPPHATADAEQTLAERYARGEIDEDEYRHRLDVLRQATHVGEPR